MRKREAVNIFGESMADVGRALNLSRARICQWPDKLKPAQIDRVLGAAVRLGVPLPRRYLTRQLRAHRWHGLGKARR